MGNLIFTLLRLNKITLVAGNYPNNINLIRLFFRQALQAVKNFIYICT